MSCPSKKCSWKRFSSSSWKITCGLRGKPGCKLWIRGAPQNHHATGFDDSDWGPRRDHPLPRLYHQQPVFGIHRSPGWRGDRPMAHRRPRETPITGSPLMGHHRVMPKPRDPLLSRQPVLLRAAAQFHSPVQVFDQLSLAPRSNHFAFVFVWRKAFQFNAPRLAGRVGQLRFNGKKTGYQSEPAPALPASRWRWS